MTLMTLPQFRESLQAVLRSADLPALHGQMQALAQQLGFEHFVYALRVPENFTQSSILMVDGYPPGWTDHYMAQAHHAHDPVIRYCSRNILPVLWHEVPGGGPCPNARRVMGEAAEHGLRTGLSVPLHTPHGELGILSGTVSRTGRAAQADMAQVQAHAHLLATHVHEAMRRLAPMPLQPPALSPREQQVLRWAADGKTSWEISCLLHISERTANFHLHTVAQKLGVFSRQHAIARALLLGLIQPSPF
ncbi:DNA-binding protein with HTH domain containing protein [Acidovorax sp. CF316]|uniref:LuxR family transcriptional regulator n=1 Tax=Acidovorax sp. CF316 TaxID=1144317 RepID=UPI00026BE2CB|nr:LuxR family transcriptional regulator [Acidovorax sp. CF316]EJE49357.1 DNA-binding protein with HTH domain containing protein [Acidovorax sp. CF316]